MNSIKDKVIVITGGAEGIGYNIADKYLKSEAKVIIILDINEEKGIKAVEALNSLYGIGKSIFIRCDVTKDLEEVSNKIIHTHKNIDVLVNNAGIMDETALRKTMEVNVIALMEWSKVFWEHMRTDKGGKGGTIVNVASTAGVLIDPFLIYYKCSKFAVVAFSKSLGHEYNFKKTGVRVFALCPSLTNTSMAKRMAPWDDHTEVFEKFVKTITLQSPDFVGNAALEVFQKAISGTAWLIKGETLVTEAPDIIKRTYAEIVNS